ncbi:MAG: fluoride efflux transporter CrcB [gamma proteobacterium symbiont of Bathyaustriella thionipta]|nr:fluoride efflux transporter CrcB [gamma proteobacterium symbiont of Bathyaustriella thionipta]MCU7950323.1 fluoride efflux transporter CrcB [gamma proteobacterium symbiont of Bathyaustriella thionipta]MCU7954598.1 fluoride efflux transporter CrcB [gamma proteobacterium symbiont of Bathyaustriella thionipta]MCU7956835.1 fluoride efflux transporter CrcB [gamma proteobacterium symbiont of Bathyaustriella thionipta]
MGEFGAIAVGGAFGAIMRFWVSGGVYTWLGRDFPYGTLSVNVIGSFLIGVVSILLTERLTLGAEVRSFIMIGFLGAFTTFSTFSLETLFLLQEGLLVKAAGNILTNVLFCIMATWGGIMLARSL